MKKINLLVISLLLIPLTVKAATSTPNVKTLEASSLKDTINYNGTMEDGSYAVMCKLYNANDEEIDLLSSAVENGAFTGSFTNVENGTYNVLCANYEGGEFKKVEVIVNNVETTTEDKDNPKTGDNLFVNVSILGFSLAGIIGLIVYNKKKWGVK